MAERELAGYRYQDRVSVGFFGEIYRGRDAEGSEVRIVHVDPELAEHEGFAAALAAQTEKLRVLEHERVLATRKIGRARGELVVVTAPVAGPVSLEDLARDAGGKLPGDVALGIALHAVEGLAYAHSLGIVHGCVHPRSVLIDFHGGVKLADFGLAHAYAEAVIRSSGSDLSGSSAGYLAPELALGKAPSVPSDVYAAGALLFSLIRGAPPPGQLSTSPEVQAVVEKALSSDAALRFLNGTELEEVLEEAITADGEPVALPEDIASFVTEQRRRAEASLDRATEDLLAEIGPSAEPSPGRREMTEVLEDLASESGGDVGFEDFSAAGDHTEVDDPERRLREGDPVSELIRLGPEASGTEPVDAVGEDTPLPEPVPHHESPGSVPRPLEAGAPEPEPAPDSEAEPVRPRAAVAPEVISPEDFLRPRHKPPVLLWLGITVFVLASLFGVLYTQTDIFHPERAQAKKERLERERQEALAEAREGQPKPGTVVVDSSPPESAVWLLLGRTPLESIRLPADRVHELRLEHDGYLPLDMPVTSVHWDSDEREPRAEVRGKLVPGEPKRPVSAYPPEPEGARAGGPSGVGTIHVKSEPPGAQVWLLIGFTPNAQLRGIEAGKGYEFKVLKDGYRPGVAVVKEEQWYLTGKGGPLKQELRRSVELAPIGETARGGRGTRRR